MENYTYYYDLFKLYYNSEIRCNNKPIFLFNCLPLSLLLYVLYSQGHINTYAYIRLQKMTRLCCTTEQGNYAFLTANLTKFFF